MARSLKFSIEVTELLERLTAAGKAIADPKQIQGLLGRALERTEEVYRNLVFQDVGVKTSNLRDSFKVISYINRRGNIAARVGSFAPHTHLLEAGTQGRQRRKFASISESGRTSMNPPGWTGFGPAFRLADRAAVHLPEAVRSFNTYFAELIAKELNDG